MTTNISIKHIKVRRFGCLPEGMRISFNPTGINIIAGPNESGKTTTMQAILGTIFGDHDVKRYLPWSSPPDVDFSASIELVLEDNSFLRIDRNFRNYDARITQTLPDGSQKKVFQGEVNPLGRKASNQEYATFIQKIFGFSTCGFFSNIHFIRQEEIDDIDLTNSFLQQVGTGERENLQGVIRDLEESHRKLTSQSPFYKRATDKDYDVEILQKEIQELEEKRTTVLASRDNSTALLEAREQLEHQKAQKAQEISSLQQEISLQDMLFRLINERKLRLERLKNATNQKERLDILRSQIVETEATLNEKYKVFLGAPDDFLRKCDELSRLQHSRSEKQKNLDEERQYVESYTDEFNTMSSKLADMQNALPLKEADLEAVRNLLETHKDIILTKNELHEYQKMAEVLRSKTIRYLVPAIASLLIFIAGLISGSYLIILPGLCLLLIDGYYSFRHVTTLSANAENKKHLHEQIQQREMHFIQYKESFAPALQKIVDSIISGATTYQALQNRFTDIKRFESSVNDMKKEIERSRQRAESLQTDIQSLDKSIHKAEETYGAYIIQNDIALTQTHFAEYLEINGRLQTLLTSFENEDSMESVRDRASELEFAYMSVDKEIRDFIALNPPMAYLRDAISENPARASHELEQKKQSLTEMKNVLERIKDAYRDVVVKLEHLQSQHEQSSAETLTELIEERHAALESLQRRAKAIFIAHGFLQQAIGRFENKYAFDILQSASSMFSGVTGGRYRAIERDGDSASLLTQTGETVEPESLSQGAQDQLYLSLRIALAEALSRKVRLPLLLDDPFVHCDKHRLEAIAEVFQTLAPTWQIILFTCHAERFAGWGACVHDFSSTHDLQL